MLKIGYHDFYIDTDKFKIEIDEYENDYCIIIRIIDKETGKEIDSQTYYK
jgi:hypothetical protein